MRNTSLLWLAGAALLGCGDDQSHPLADAPRPPLDVAAGSDARLADAPIDAPPDGPPCAGTVCGSACVDTGSDPDNCGVCGHVCGGCGAATCTAGACDDAVLAAGQGGPFTLALDPANNTLYWGDDTGRDVSTVDASGSGSASMLIPTNAVTAVRGFAFDPTRLYLTRAVFNILETCTLAGADCSNLTNQQENGAEGMVADATAVYWTTKGTGNIRRANLGAPVQTPTTLVSGQAAPDGLAEDDTALYWTTNTATGTVMSVPKTGGPPTTLITGQALPHAIAVAGGFVYWTDQGSGSGTASVQRVAVAGGGAQPVASGLTSTGELAVAGGFAYWTDPVGGQVLRAPITGGSAEVVASGEATPEGIVATDACVYFADYAAGSAGSGSIRAHEHD